jgi:hypothetical protein
MRSAFAVALAVSTVSAAARADHPRARLIYDVPARCPAATDFAASVAARLGHDPFTPKARNVVAVSIVEDAGAFSATVTLREGAQPIGERRVPASGAVRSCTDLVETTAASVALLLEPDGPFASDDDDEPVKAPSRATEPVVEAPVPEVARPGPPPSPPVELLALIATFGSVGSVPSPTLGFAAGIAVERAGLRLEIDGRVDLPREDEAGRATFGRTTLAVRPCVRRGILGACLGGGVARVWGEGAGTTRDPRLDAVWLGWLGARAFVATPTSGPLRARLFLDAELPVSRAAFAIGSETVFRTPAVLVAAGIGFEYVAF